MSNEDLFQSQESNLPKWNKHEFIKFSSPKMMMDWIKEDSKTLVMSHKIFQSVIYCLDNNIDGIVPMTLVFESSNPSPSDIPTDVKALILPDDTVFVSAYMDIEIIKANFQLIIERYVERLLEFEQYEKLSEILPMLSKHGYNVPI